MSSALNRAVLDVSAYRDARGSGLIPHSPQPQDRGRAVRLLRDLLNVRKYRLVEFYGRLYHIAREASFEAKVQGQSPTGVGRRWVVVVAGERSIRSNQQVGRGYTDAEHRSELPSHSL